MNWNLRLLATFVLALTNFGIQIVQVEALQCLICSSIADCDTATKESHSRDCFSRPSGVNSTICTALMGGTYNKHFLHKDCHTGKKMKCSEFVITCDSDDCNYWYTPDRFGLPDEVDNDSAGAFLMTPNWFTLTFAVVIVSFSYRLETLHL